MPKNITVSLFCMNIYKGYNQEALDKQYNNRATVPNFVEIVENWRQRSAIFKSSHLIVENLPYGAHPRERLDIFPAGDGAPVQVFFHGGYWRALEKETFLFMAAGFVKHQIATVLVNYPLAPEVTMDEIVASCRKAMVWIYHHIAGHGGDSNQIYISGHSAGGHLVAMLMATAWPEFETGLPPNLIKGGCAISGLFNLIPIQLSFLNETLGMDETAARRNSPAFLPYANKCPLIVTVGQLESDEYHAQSRELIDVWQSQGLSITHLPIPNAGHFSILDHVISDEAPLNQAILAQMKG